MTRKRIFESGRTYTFREIRESLDLDYNILEKIVRKSFFPEPIRASEGRGMRHWDGDDLHRIKKDILSAHREYVEAIRESNRIFPLAEETIIHGRPYLLVEERDLMESPGVYFLIKDNETVYIGQSVRPSTRLYEHYGNPSKKFDHAIVIAVERDDLSLLEGALIRKYRPPLNGSTVTQNQKRNLGARGDSSRDAEILEKYGWPDD